MTHNKVNSKRRKPVIGDTSSSEHSRAAEVIAGNEDLLTEILLRVPAKSLIRFKCVSKHWLSLISDSQFACNHAGRNPRSSISGLYFYLNRWSSNEQLQSVSLDGHPNLLPTLTFLDGVVAASSTVTIERSCNGLILCSNGFRKPPYIVCNLTSKKYTVLPDPGAASSRAYHNNVGAFLAFDPSKSPHFKVLLFSYNYYANDGQCIDIGIYRSESSSWKHIRVAKPLGVRFTFKVFWNGAIHGINNDNLHIRFEVEEEKLIQTTMPPNPKILSSNKIMYFGECGGDLLLIQTRQRSAMGFRILEMDRDYCRWIVKYRVNLRPISYVFSEIVHTNITRSYKFNVLCVVKGGNEKDFSLVLAIPGKIVSYNPKSKTLKVLRDLPLVVFDHQVPAWSNTYQFIASLSSV